MKVSEIFESRTDEGAMDYVRGVGRHFGDKIKNNLADAGEKILEPFRAAHAAGQQASAAGDERTQAKKASQRAAQFKADLDYTINQLSLVISKIQRPSSTNEGMWDYMRGAGSAVGQQAQRAGSAVKSAVQNIPGAIQRGAQSIHQQGQASSRTAEQQKLSKTRNQLVQKLIQLASALNPETAEQQIVAAIRQHGKQNQLSQSLIMRTITAFSTAYRQSNQQRQAPTF